MSVTWPHTTIAVDTSQIQSPPFDPPVKYVYEAYETMTNDFIGELPVTYGNYGPSLNAPGGGELHLPLRTNKINEQTFERFTSNQYEEYATSVIIKRNDAIVWGGFLGRARASSLDARVSFALIGFWDYFRGRMIRANYNYSAGMDQLDVARDLVNRAQAEAAGDINVDPYATTNLSGVEIAPIYDKNDFKIFADAIEDLARTATGFDFRIQVTSDANGLPVKSFQVGYPKLGTRRDTVLEVGRNIVEWQWNRDGSLRPNRIWGVGAGEGAGTLVVLSEDTPSFGRVPLREGTIVRKELTQRFKSTLQAITDRERRKFTQPVETVTVTCIAEGLIGAFLEGDSLKVVINDGYLQIDTYMRVLSYTVRIQDNQQELIDIELGPEWATGG